MAGIVLSVPTMPVDDYEAHPVTQGVQELIEENTRLKQQLYALQKKQDAVLSSLQDSVDSILRLAREGKSES